MKLEPNIPGVVALVVPEKDKCRKCGREIHTCPKGALRFHKNKGVYCDGVGEKMYQQGQALMKAHREAMAKIPD